jgi:hypothetical protein
MRTAIRKAETPHRWSAPRGRRLVTQHPRRRILSLAAGAAELPGIAWTQAYPTRPVRIIVGAAGGGGMDHSASDRAMALGATWATICHREPAGRRHQHRRRGGRS